jgi:hypothetical protein
MPLTIPRPCTDHGHCQECLSLLERPWVAVCCICRRKLVLVYPKPAPAQQ